MGFNPVSACLVVRISRSVGMIVRIIIWIIILLNVAFDRLITN